MIKTIITIFLFSMTTSTVFAAEPDSKSPEKIGRPETKWDFSGSIVAIPSADLHGIPADAGLTDYRFKLLRNLKFDDRLSFSVGGGYGLKHIDSPSSAALPDDLHAVTVELGSRYRFSPKSFASISITPGLYSDFDGNSDASPLRMPLLLLGGQGFDNGFTLIGGFLYRFGYHSSNFIPAIGFSYQPTKEWRFDAIMPRPAITYSASRKLRLFVAGDFASDEYSVNHSKTGADVLKYSDYKLSGGVTYLPIPPVRLTGAIGYAFDRSFTFYDGNRPDLRVDSTPFFRLSLDMGW